MFVNDIKHRSEGEQMKKRGALLVEQKETDLKKTRLDKDKTICEINERTIIGLKHLYLYLA